MKVVNGSTSLVDKQHISITPTEICFGRVQADAQAGLMILVAVCVGIFAPGPFLLYFALGIAMAVWAAKDDTTPDTRKRYKANEIARMVIGGVEHVGHKTAGGSLGGAAVGGLLFGGFGAVVGAVAGGNNLSEFNSVTVKFTDGEWVVLSGDNGTFTDSTELKLLLKLAGTNNECPI